MNKRVLIVEDEPDIVRGLTDALEFEGFDVVSKGFGQDGVRVMRDKGADCVILDLMLPDINGYAVCEEIRGFNALVPIIILTARGQESDKIRGLDAGADDYVTKPFSVGERRADAAQHGTDARHQLGGRERLGDVVVGAGVDPLDLVAPPVAGGQDQDRHRASGLAPGFEDRNAVPLRQADVEYDGVVRLCVSAKPPFFPVEGAVDGIARGLEGSGHLAIEIAIVFDNQ